MAYIGKQPVIGNFVKLDAISVVNGQAAYTMQNGGVNFTSYDNVNQFLVSLNGILQSPTDSFTVSGSTLTFASNLSTGDVIDFVMVLGNTLDIGTPSDNTVSLAKLTATGTKDATTFLRGDNTFASPSGGLLQTVTATTGTSTSITTTSYADTNITASITPSSTSSKILIMVHCQVEAGTSVALHGDIERDIGGSTTLLSGDADGFFRQQDSGQQNQATIITVDSPSTTSAITYTVQGKNSTSGTSFFQNGGSVASIVLQEISG